MLIFKIQVALRLRWYRHHVWAKFHLFQWEEHIFVVNRWVGIPVLFVPSSATIVDACALELSVALCEHPNVDILFGACTNSGKPSLAKYIHTLNSTLVAIERTIVSIMENFQTHDGHIRIPQVLQKYFGEKII